MKKITINIAITILLLTLTSCTLGTDVSLEQPDTQIQFTAPGPNPELDTPAANGIIAGFGTGLIHGLISVVTLIISFTNADVQMYEVHNNGPFYNLGFLLGTILLFGILGYTRGRRR